MATGQSLLNYMEDLNSELQLQSGEANVAKGLRALNAAQDLFESVLATYPLGKYGAYGTVTTTANTETTAFPSGILRIDDLWLLDSSTLRAKRKLDNIQETGGHAFSAVWPQYLINTPSSGEPEAYYMNGTTIFWSPIPDATYTVRWYGFQSAADITASGTFAYDDVCLFPIASVASKMVKVGLDDPIEDITSQAKEVFDTLIQTLSGYNRTGGLGYNYRYSHST